MTAQGLIDTTEMYLRTVFELEEEGIVPLRARIAERLAPERADRQPDRGQDGTGRPAARGGRPPAVAQRARPDAGHQGHAQAPAGRVPAGQRDRAALGRGPHRGVPVGARHLRDVERRLVEMLGYPVAARTATSSPASTSSACRGPTDQIDEKASGSADEAMTNAASREPAPVVVQRISEQIQSDLALMLKLKRTGIQPGREVMLAASDDGVRVTCDDSADGAEAELPREIAAHVFVSRP